MDTTGNGRYIVRTGSKVQPDKQASKGLTMSEAEVRKFVKDRTAAFWKMEGERFLYLSQEIKAAMLFRFVISTCVLQGWDTDDIQNVMAVLAEAE